MATKQDNMTPMMRQFHDLKEKHPTAILLFRCGDFYECYEQDACICAKELGITLTKAKDGTHMAGFPHHALDTYLTKLFRYCNQPESIMKRVAICDQLELPKQTKKSAVSELINNLATNNRNNNPKTKTTMATKKSTKNESVNKSAAQFSVITYTTKKGGTACYIAGFKSEAEAKALAEQLPHSISNSYRYNDKGEKVYVLSFGTRYVAAAQTLCDALNAGDKAAVAKAVASCHDIYTNAVAAGKAERERKSEERKAAKAKEKADRLAKVKKENGLYSMDDIAAMMRRAMAGEEVPELAEVKKLLEAA